MCILLIVLLCLQTSNNSFYPTGHGTKRRVSMHPCMTWMEVQSFRYMAVLRIGRRGEGILVKCECTLSFYIFHFVWIILMMFSWTQFMFCCSNIGLPFYGRSFAGDGLTGIGQVHSGYADTTTWSDDEGSPQCKSAYSNIK